MRPYPQFTVDLVIFTEKILNESFHFCAINVSLKIFQIPSSKTNFEKLNSGNVIGN